MFIFLFPNIIVDQPIMLKRSNNIKCVCPSCKTNINIDVDVTKCNTRSPVCETPSCKQGSPGARGTRGAQGQRGYQGEHGPVGPPGPQGNQGTQGTTGPRGSTGSTGPLGPTGPTGATGSGNRWFLGFDCTPTGTSEVPQPGDLLLDLNSCNICRFTDDDIWVPTQQNINCLSCDDVFACLKSLPMVSPQSGNCFVTLILNNLANVFNSGLVQITQLVIADIIQDISPIMGMTFNTPTQLATVLAVLGFEYAQVFNTNVYTFNTTIIGPLTGTNTYISFGNGDTYNLNLQCF